MSTVLWANALLDGRVESDQADRVALYRHADRLDKVCRDRGLRPLTETHDTIDARVNLEVLDLPAGMDSTDELMAQQGVWVDAAEMRGLLEAVRDEVVAKNIRFGLLRNDHDEVVRELEEAILFARDAESKGAQVNFAVVS